MGAQQVFTAFLLITHGSAVLSHSDPKCETPVGADGFCVSRERCQNIHNLLNGGKPPRGLSRYIEKAACTLLDGGLGVCCRPEEILTKKYPKLTIGHKPTPGAKLNSSLVLPTGDCGLVSVDKIMSYGKETRPFEFPWMVLLRYEKDDQIIDGCGGSLINDRYVLTAAHCVKTHHTVKLVNVRLGEHDKTTALDCITYSDGSKDCAEAYDVAVEKTIIHEDYNRSVRFLHDIALIRMAEKVSYSNSVKPICLPAEESVRHIHIPKYIVTGWGLTEERTASQVLLQVVVNNLPTAECEPMLQQFDDQNITLTDTWQMCALGKNRADHCAGDSGGPLGSVLSVGDIPRFIQMGIICAGSNLCGQMSSPGIYTRVSSYMDWIVANIEP